MSPRSFFLLLALGTFTPSPVPAADPAAPSSPGKPAPVQSQVQGTCTIELKLNGTVQYLVGLGIAVVPESAVVDIKRVRNERWLLRASRSNFNDGFNDLDLNGIGGTAVQNALTTTKADEKGKYHFSGLPPGNYRLYAQYHSRYALGYWLAPFKIVRPTDTITLDLNNSNMEEAYNLFQKQ